MVTPRVASRLTVLPATGMPAPLQLKPPVRLAVVYGCGGERLTVEDETGRLIDLESRHLHPEEGDRAQPHILSFPPR